MANRRRFRKRQSVGEYSLNTLPGFQSRSSSPGPAEEPRDGKPSASVRPEKIARAERLVQDENYPSREVIGSVAELLAKHLQPGARE